MEYGKHLLHIVCRRCFYAFISDHRRPRGDASGRAGRPVLERQRRMQQGLGLPQPEPDGLRLRARLSNRSCPFSGQTRILTDQTPEPEPEPEPEPAPAEPELLPFEPEKPFERISEFSVMNVAEQGGKPYWKVPG